MRLTHARLAALCLAFSLLLAGCSLPSLAAPAASATPDPTATDRPTDTATPTVTPSPTATFTPTETATPTWAVSGPGTIVCPILLYHHVAPAPENATSAAKIYYVPADEFEAELKALHDWGYQTISTLQLQQAILSGAALPEHSLIISFDDGNLDIYQNAFPLMQKYGFTGVVYIIADTLQSAGYMNADQLKTLAAAGWEIGSHSLTHHDLRADPSVLQAEIAGSRQTLEQAVGVQVRSFAYPYGLTDAGVTRRVEQDGYLTGMGLGGGWNQGLYDLYYLGRRPVLAGIGLATFAAYLPYSGLATPTATP